MTFIAGTAYLLDRHAHPADADGNVAHLALLQFVNRLSTEVNH
jgi:hypothetical protein